MRAVNEDAALGIGRKGGLVEELRAEQIAPGTVLADIAVPLLRPRRVLICPNVSSVFVMLKQFRISMARCTD